jgi:hypothetical protein
VTHIDYIKIYCFYAHYMYTSFLKPIRKLDIKNINNIVEANENSYTL